MKDDDAFDAMLQKGIGTSEMTRLRETWRLNDPELFGGNVELERHAVHVLVAVPHESNQVNTSILGQRLHRKST
ncbi:TPA: hypothetical protein N0F65_009809 [Lagenidium giganteum]|uniref:Uncharacterized protein n=1 Tax=Lagenidium giganteum TaxID=4803 RepID=A0AAV2YLK1_9STRA|nr:TPA: hypothetical protein N0F65_009809 [Lagenidium giganteum]